MMRLAVHLLLRFLIPDAHLDPFEIADITQRHLTGLRGCAQMARYIHIILRTGEPLFQVAEIIGISIRWPCLQGIVGIG